MLRVFVSPSIQLLVSALNWDRPLSYLFKFAFSLWDSIQAIKLFNEVK